MKSTRKYISILVLILSFSIPLTLIGQGTPPPPPSGHGNSGDQGPGGGAPIGSGLFVLLSLGATYGGRKTFQLFQSEKE